MFKSVHFQNRKCDCIKSLKLGDFDETAFLEQVDHIEVPKRYQIEIHLKDGRVVTEGLHANRPSGLLDTGIPGQGFRAAQEERYESEGSLLLHCQDQVCRMRKQLQAAGSQEKHRRKILPICLRDHQGLQQQLHS